MRDYYQLVSIYWTVLNLLINGINMEVTISILTYYNTNFFFIKNNQNKVTLTKLVT